MFLLTEQQEDLPPSVCGGMLMTCYSLFDGNLNLLWYLVASIFQFFICFDKEKILCCRIQLCSS